LKTSGALPIIEERLKHCVGLGSGGEVKNPKGVLQ
jgi:hypothetical protein